MKFKIVLVLVLLCTSVLLKAQAPSTNGLVLWLKADAGVTADANGVSEWIDQSGNGNNAGPLSADYNPVGTEAPTLQINVVTGLYTIQFDGVDDVLEIPNSDTLQPGDGSWTVIFVGSRVGRGVGDFPQVIGSRPWLAGTDKGWAVCLDANGLVSSHFADDVSGHDAPSVQSATALGESIDIWQVEEDRASAKTTFYKRGDVDRTSGTAMPSTTIDQFNPIFIGRDMDGGNSRRANINLAEVLIYNRVLDKQERLDLTSYLANRYGLPFSVNLPPTITLDKPANGTTVAAPGTVVISATPADPDGSIARVEFYSGTTLLGAATAAPYTLTLKTLVPGTLNLTAVAVDNRGERATSAVAVVTVTGVAPNLSVKSGLELWLEADQGVSVDDTGMNWSDQSGNTNNASQIDPAQSPQLIDNDVNGKPALRFDGQDDFLQIANAPSLQPGTGSWTVFFVAKRNVGSQGDFPQIIGSRPWERGLDIGWAVSFNSGGLVASHYADESGGHDVPGTLAAAPLSLDEFQLWQVEENRTAATTSFYLDGSLNAALPRAMPQNPITQTNNVYIGREIGGANNRRASMDLAEVLVYNQTLRTEDREGVTAYLSGKYGVSAFSILNTAPAVAITAPASGATLNFGDPVNFTADANDADGSVALVNFYAGTQLLGSATAKPYSITVTNLGAGEQILTAQAVDNLGAIGISAAVTVTNKVAHPPQPLNLISQPDYSDTFTVGATGTATQDNTRPNGMYNDNTFGGYNVENSYGNPQATWTPTANFSFASPSNSTGPAITQAASGNTGATNGFAQSGGGDFNFAYGLRSDYIVQVDAILPLDRLDIGSFANAGDTIGGANSLNVFFRKDSSSAPGIGLYNGSKETGLTDVNGNPLHTGVNDQNWHSFAVRFNQAAKTLAVYVDGVQKGSADLSTFAGGIYADFSNAAVGVGGAGFNGTQAQWMDNFQVGAPSLIGLVDYSDSFTVGPAGTPSADNPRPNKMYNINTFGGYTIENNHGNPQATWTPTANFSFNSPDNSTGPDITQAATGNPGAATGFAQSGGGDFSIVYGLRDEYLVSVDAILPLDRLDLSSLPSAGVTISAAPSLTVFFRKDSLAGNPNPGISLFNGSKETGVLDLSGNAAKTGVDDANWHNFGVQFNRTANRLAIFVDGQLKADVDLATFASGAYQNYSNAALGVGGAGFNGTQAQWMDNFAAGLPGPGALASQSNMISIGPLTITRIGTQVQISWNTPGVLESADDLKGQFIEVPAASSGIKLDFQGTQKFFRLRN